MKKSSLLTFGMLGLLCAASSTHALAANASVEVGMQSSGDLSMFYQALLNTSVINELNENEEYTIFAPVNSAFSQIPRTNYPCFYSEQCRPQIAAMLRNHILKGHYELTDLVTYGQGIQTDGARRLHIEEPFVNDYAVNNQGILSKEEVGGTVIYRISGVIANPQELAQFQTVSVIPAATTVTTEKTITKRTYNSPSSSSPEIYPAGSMDPMGPGAAPAGNTSQTTTVIHTYTDDDN